MIVVDTGALFAAMVRSQRHHEEAKRALAEDAGPFVLSPFVLGELDYLVTESLGVEAELELLGQIEEGAYDLADVSPDDVGPMREAIHRYHDLRIGLADASIVVLAHRYRTDRLLTLDERHFRAMRTLDGRPFTLLPADA